MSASSELSVRKSGHMPRPDQLASNKDSFALAKHKGFDSDFEYSSDDRGICTSSLHYWLRR
eukprot:9213-Heterococcus_DN1.PRE.1